MNSVAWIIMIVTMGKVVHTLSSRSVCLSLIRREPDLCLCAHTCAKSDGRCLYYFPFFSQTDSMWIELSVALHQRKTCGVCALNLINSVFQSF